MSVNELELESLRSDVSALYKEIEDLKDVVRELSTANLHDKEEQDFYIQSQFKAMWDQFREKEKII